MRAWFVIPIALSACGSPAKVEALVGAPATTTATRASADDAIVATVNGKPVWGSCVVAQAARGAESGSAAGGAEVDDKRAALDQCIAFELLAQKADQAGLALDPEVARATHTAMVSELVSRAYEDGFNDPAKFGPFWQKAYKQTIWHLRHENYRASSYVRLPVPDKAPQSVVDAQKKIADQIAAALANEPGISGPNLLPLAQAVVPNAVLDHEDVTAYRQGALDEGYANALFALQQIGRTSSAVRTKWGWDVIVWTDDVPAADPPESEVIAKLLPDVKIAYFAHWVEAIGQSLGVTVTYDQQNVARLEDL
jgi:hypothetical protein